MQLISIVCTDKNGVIADSSENIMLWHSRYDLNRFKELTSGFPVIMGRKTYESIGKPLKGRLNIILTNDREFRVNITSQDQQVIIFYNKEDILNSLKLNDVQKAFVIGGAQIYKLFENDITHIFHTKLVKHESGGDVKYPLDIDEFLFNQNVSIEKSQFINFNESEKDHDQVFKSIKIYR